MSNLTYFELAERPTLSRGWAADLKVENYDTDPLVRVWVSHCDVGGVWVYPEPGGEPVFLEDDSG